MHQGIVVALQVEADGLRIKAPGVILEISAEALRAAQKAQNGHNQRRVCKVREVSPYGEYNPHRRR